MRKKTISLILALIMMSATSVNAQVRIGGDDNPNESAVLDLNATNAANNSKLGLALPRVALTSTASFAPLKAHVAGMMVYNTGTVGDVTPGTYYNDGTKWIRVGSGALTVETDGGLTIISPMAGNESYTFGISTGGVTTSKIADNAVTLAKMAANSVDSTKIVDKSIGSADIANNAVITANIRDANVTKAKIAANSVDSTKIVDKSIGSADIANNAVITANIRDANVTTVKIADKAVTAAKLADGVLTSTAAPIITAQPKSFSWSRMKETNSDPNSTVTSFSPTLTITASGSGLSYKWYKKAKNKNVADTQITTATTNSYIPTLTAWGMDSYYCVVSNAYGSVTSNIAEVAAGCGAKTVDGGWLKFMCHNLGASPLTATQSLDAITFAIDTTSSDAKGWLFQWGRAADGHQWRGRDAYATVGAVTLNEAEQIPSTHAAYGLFIKVTAIPYDWRIPQYDYLWRNWNDNRFPCPFGWKVPSSLDWNVLYRSGSTYGAPSQATANTWVWVNKGYAIRPDGVTTTLFLPAAGYRENVSAVLGNAGSYGSYWSSTTASSGAFNLNFGSSRVSPETSNARVYGFSVRCVSE